MNPDKIYVTKPFDRGQTWIRNLKTNGFLRGGYCRGKSTLAKDFASKDQNAAYAIVSEYIESRRFVIDLLGLFDRSTVARETSIEIAVERLAKTLHQSGFRILIIDNVGKLDGYLLNLITESLNAKSILVLGVSSSSSSSLDNSAIASLKKSQYVLRNLEFQETCLFLNDWVEEMSIAKIWRGQSKIIEVDDFKISSNIYHFLHYSFGGNVGHISTVLREAALNYAFGDSDESVEAFQKLLLDRVYRRKIRLYDLFADDQLSY